MGKVEPTAQCPNCGTELRSGIIIENSGNIVLTGNKIKCPNCGQWVPLDDRKIRKA